eukprot:COSAG02_NODE_11441_length_1723_cov_1.435961_2_plen_191_part_00
MQKKKALVPLMMTEGYEADGWLGLLLGTSMWYGFYGETLSSVSGFDGRMDALCREIGSRGRADAVDETASRAGATEPGDTISLAEEVRAMKGSVLRKRAISAGVSQAELEEADDADDIRAEIIKLILAHESADADRMGAARAELLESKTSSLRKQAIAAGATAEAMEAVDDATDIKAALVELILLAGTQQ